MNWQEIKVSADGTHFLFEQKPIFNKLFIEVLKFHPPGLAAVIDSRGAYHIDTSGNELYSGRFTRTFGYYCDRAAVSQNQKWFHLNEKGARAYDNFFSWTGNFQEDLCPVRNTSNNYFHIAPNGGRAYRQNFLYAGDFKDGIACVKTASGYYKHIDTKGNFLNNREFQDLGIFHKNYAMAKDKNGWHHIDKNGNELYGQRYLSIEPFYNGFALVTELENKKVIINENGEKILTV